MIPVEIKLNDFEEYIKFAKFYIRTVLLLMISGCTILIIMSALCEVALAGVVTSFLVITFILFLSDPKILRVIKSYKTVKLFYKNLFTGSATPVSFKPMLIEGFYNRADLTYNFKFKIYSYS